MVKALIQKGCFMTEILSQVLNQRIFSQVAPTLVLLIDVLLKSTEKIEQWVVDIRHQFSFILIKFLFFFSLQFFLEAFLKLPTFIFDSTASSFVFLLLDFIVNLDLSFFINLTACSIL